MSQKLRKIMVENVVTAERNASVKDVAELMNKHNIGCIVIVEDEKPVGIVTERDMLKRVVCKMKDPEKTRVCEIMSEPLVAAIPNMRAGDAARLMLERNIKKLPVVENERLAGLVTLTDLIRSEGVIDYLNGLSLSNVSQHVKKTVELYFDPLKQHRRKCPLMMKDGFSMGCQSNKCMWWVGDECAITKISRTVEYTPLDQIICQAKD